MKVEKDVLQAWEDLKEYGDFSEIKREHGIHRNAIADAFTSGECSSEVYVALNTFYANKRQRIEESKAKITPAA